MSVALDDKRLDKILDKYPQLEVIMLSGMVSMKMCRELLDVDRWLMSDIYKELVLAQAVTGVSSSCFRAKPDAVTHIKERRGMSKGEQ